MRAASRTRALIAAIAAAAIVMAGCSSTDTPSPSTGTSASSASATDSPSGESTESGTATETSAATDTTVTSAAVTTGGNAAPAATTEVPAPNGGNINQTVPSVSLSTNSPVAVTATGNYGNGVTVKLAGIESVTAQAELPGEVSGPGIKLTVDIVNASSTAIDVGNVVVDLQDAQGTPAIPMSADPAKPFTGAVQPGTTATAIYVFAVPKTYTSPATISVSYSTEVPVVVFVGDAK